MYKMKKLYKRKNDHYTDATGQQWVFIKGAWRFKKIRFKPKTSKAG